ncbi:MULTISPECIES: glycosyltransferase family 1 protein [Bacillus]|uniref:glycosyltransferase family 1 protein n=1 Tax=Bacillus TaxID=1386 RepID=UPI001E283639|nr:MULTISPECIES: glycosyltransferase family 1 protein [Bacillus cereus group]MCC2412738.1 glycosyltransferase family 1 protein [Bacillus paranthracis]MDA1896224.1 glycosyltransferase family 1 protein [Bacillus cereus group sp. BcHK28]HDR7894655.1 glycosyltransferase family 1 protein [Bacillus pacificus]
MKPIRVLQVAGKMRSGGAEAMIMNIYRNIDDKYVQFDFVSFDEEEGYYDKEIKKLGGRIFYIPSPEKIGVLQFISNLVRLLKKEGPFDIVHAHTLYNIGLVLLAARLAGIKKRIAHSHSTKASVKQNLLHKIYQVIMGKLINLNATEFIACGTEAGEFLYGKSKFKKRGKVLPNAIDVFPYLNKENLESENLYREHKIRENTFIMGQVGTLNEIKNHDFTISICKRMKEKGIEFRMLFVGDGELNNVLRKRVDQEGLQNQIIFLGLRADIPNLMNLFDVLIMPSIFEGLPVTLIEAQAAGTPCVVSNVITIEADLGLGLIKYMDLNVGVDRWIDELQKMRNNKLKNSDEIMLAFEQKEYDIKSNIENLMRVYHI